MKNKGEIILKPTKDNSLRRFHPWVFSGAIAHASEGLQEGDVVKVLRMTERFLAWGITKPGAFRYAFYRLKMSLSIGIFIYSVLPKLIVCA